MKYSVLIIDDEWELREEAYRSLLIEEYFEITFFRNPMIDRVWIDSQKINFIILDVILSGYTIGSESEGIAFFEEILSYIGSKKPIV